MNQVLLAKIKLAEFVNFLGKEQKLVGPVSLGHGQFKFAEVASLAEMSLQHLPTILPPKKYYLPPHETLLKYDTSDGQKMQTVVEIEPLVIFGVHTCDLVGIQCLDQVFSEPPQDRHYLIRKDYLTLIGLECKEPCDRFATCAMQDAHLPEGGYDLFFSELATSYHVDVHTPRGAELVKCSGLFETLSGAAADELLVERALKKQRFQSDWPLNRCETSELMEQTYDSPVWEELGQRCLSCGNCTNVCPTCYCFDVLDEPDLNLATGRRLRVWDSCQHEEFAKVAGGESFRTLRSERQRHRFLRKFQYPLTRYHRSFCTGCGRCSRTCMAEINLKQTLDDLLREREQHADA